MMRAAGMDAGAASAMMRKKPSRRVMEAKCIVSFALC